MTEANDEKFKSIEGFPKYRISSLGRAQSIHTGTWKDLRPFIGSHGYETVNLFVRPGLFVHHLVHRLVANAFIPNPDKLPCVRHLDGTRRNNFVSNLAWGSYSDNEADKKAHGRWVPSRTGNRKMSSSVVAEAKRLYKNGRGSKEIAQMFGVPWSTMRHMLSGKTYTNEPISTKEMEIVQ